MSFQTSQDLNCLYINGYWVKGQIYNSNLEYKYNIEYSISEAYVINFLAKSPT